jgi:hypothetical protein
VDSEGAVLWYFYGTRLYKEVPVVNNNKDQLVSRTEKKKKKKHKKEKKKKRKKSTDTDSSEEGETAEWSVACLTEEDWKGKPISHMISNKSLKTVKNIKISIFYAVIF